MGKSTTLLLCGVGGQGTILAADLLALAALESGVEVKVSEIHGMAQRGGSVTTVVRFGEDVASMVCDEGCADFVVSFETTEALRALPFLSPTGTMIVNDETIQPLSVLSGAAVMPTSAIERLQARGATIVPAPAIAREVGNPKTLNVVLLGALSAMLPFSVDAWEQVIASRVPEKTIEANKMAFRAGRSFMEEHRHVSSG